jgi:hypothetical protein
MFLGGEVNSGTGGASKACVGAVEFSLHPTIVRISIIVNIYIACLNITHLHLLSCNLAARYYIIYSMVNDVHEPASSRHLF